jgi:hypothetical protein
LLGPEHQHVAQSKNDLGILLNAKGDYAADVTANLVLLWRLMSPPGLLATAAANSVQVRAAVLLFFVGAAGTVGLTIAAFPVFRRCSSVMALWLLALAVAAFSLQAVENAALLSTLSLSQEYSKAGAAQADLFQALDVVVSSARRWRIIRSRLSRIVGLSCSMVCCTAFGSFRAHWLRSG